MQVNNLFFFHSTCVTCDRTRRPVAERGHDAVLLAGQLTRSHCAGPRAVRTSRQQKHTQRGCRVTPPGIIYTVATKQQQDQINCKMLISSGRLMVSGSVGDTHPSLLVSFILKSLTAEQKQQLSLPDCFSSELFKDQIEQEYIVWISGHFKATQ